MGIRSDLECIPCLFSQALRAARITRLEDADARRLMVALGRQLEAMDPEASPPESGTFLYRLVAELSGRDDPYAEVKREHTEAALAALPAIRRRIRDAEDPLHQALRLSALGNRMDLGALSRVDDVTTIIEQGLKLDPGRWDVEAFRAALDRAAQLLVVGDNAGEAVFDRALLEEVRRQYPELAIAVVVRGAPVINDATMADARAAGLDQVAEVVSSGSDVPGLLLEAVSSDVRGRFDGADVVLAKGQGNYETLSGCGREVFFLLTVKCAVVERHTGAPPGRTILLRESSPR